MCKLLLLPGLPSALDMPGDLCRHPARGITPEPRRTSYHSNMLSLQQSPKQLHSAQVSFVLHIVPFYRTLVV